MSIEKRTFTKEKKLDILKEATAHGVTTTLEQFGIYPATYYSWLKKYDTMGEAGLRYGITPPQMKEIRHLDKENKTLKELLAEKDQNEEMSILVDSIIKGISSISLESLLLNSYATMLAIESLKTNQSYTIKLSYLK